MDKVEDFFAEPLRYHKQLDCPDERKCSHDGFDYGNMFTERVSSATGKEK